MATLKPSNFMLIQCTNRLQVPSLTLAHALS